MTAELIASSELPVVVGLGDTGLSCARFLHRQGQRFTVVDSRPSPPGLEQLRAECPGVPVQLGPLSSEDLTGASVLVVSPGLALSEPAIAEAMASGVPVCGDIDLFRDHVSAPVVGITGSNAKSTVTRLLGNMALRAGLDAGVGGNLGPAALDLVEPAHDIYILELSSFQLERAGSLALSVACVLNLSADHLDRHGTMPEYHRAKHRIFLDCERIVFNRDDALSRPLQTDQCPHWSFGLGEPDLKDFGVRIVEGEEWLVQGFEALMPVADLAMAGRHNVANALAALALGAAIELPLAAMLAELKEYSGLPHRCEPIAMINGVRFINDSKATNTGAAIAALQGLGEGRCVHLIAGGQGKGADFKGLADEISRSCVSVSLLGEDAALIAAAIGDRVAITFATSMTGAVMAASEQAREGDVVLLSPACASFDQYAGYAARGDDFRRIVLALEDRRHG